MPSIQLQYLDDSGIWRDVSASTNALALMESCRIMSSDPRATPLDVTVTDATYSYDLGTLTQCNRYSGFRRPLRLFSDRETMKAWMVNDGRQWSVTSHVTQAIDGWRNAGFLTRMHRHMPVYILGRTYQIDLDDASDPTRGFLRDMFNGEERALRQANVDLRTVLQTPSCVDKADEDGEEGADDDVSSSDDVDDDDDDVPHELRCPITTRIMRRPVEAEDGTVYEESAIRRWFERRVVSPMTNAPLSSDDLTLHIPTLTAVARYRASAREKRQLDVEQK